MNDQGCGSYKVDHKISQRLDKGSFLRRVFMHQDYGSFSLKRGRLLVFHVSGPWVV